MLRSTSWCFSLFYMLIGYLKLKVALIKEFLVNSYSKICFEQLWWKKKVAKILKSTSSCSGAPAHAFGFYQFHFLLVAVLSCILKRDHTMSLLQCNECNALTVSAKYSFLLVTEVVQFHLPTLTFIQLSN